MDLTDSANGGTGSGGSNNTDGTSSGGSDNTGGTSMTVNAIAGSPGSANEPIGSPSVFCGEYVDRKSGVCGLPERLSDITELNTGLRWSHAAASGLYRVAFHVWMGDGSGNLESHLMVWLRDPPRFLPAGSRLKQGVVVENVAGQWDIRTGTFSEKPIISYVRSEGSDTHELAVDMMDFFNDLPNHELSLPG